MATILVTGGAGYVGSVCAEELIRQGHEVVVVDDLSTGHHEAVPTSARFYRADIGDKIAMRSILREHDIDAVFHFAAKALIPESVTDPAVFYKVNVTSALAMMDVLLETGVRRFVFSSTAAVYGDPVQVPIPEDHPKSPVNSYGETKLAFERALEWYSKAYGFSVVAFRYFNASGATENHGEMHEPETHIIPLVYEAAVGERPVFTIYGGDYDTPDGTCLRDYVHVLDIAQAHILALKHMQNPGFRAYNIGLGLSFSVKQLCESAEEVTGMRIPVKIGPRRIGDPSVLCADPRRLMSELGWTPKHSDLREILKSAWSWKQQQAKKIGTASL
jgi:UDP-glucose 4-epimerase